MRCWIFQFNPDRFNALPSFYGKDEHHWTIKQYAGQIRKGDICLIWQSGKSDIRGIYAIGEIVTDPAYILDPAEESKNWKKEKDRNKKEIRVKFVFTHKLLDDPILLSEIRSYQELQGLAIIRQPQCSNSPVVASEWSVIEKLIENRGKIA